MVGSLEHDDVLLLGCVSGKFDGRLHSFGSRIPEEECIKALGGHLGLKLFNELQHGLVIKDVTLSVGKRSGLFLNSLYNVRVTVT